MKYMLLMQGPRSGYEKFGALPPQDIKAHIDFMKRVNKDLTESGELVDAQGLAGPDQAKVVQIKTGTTPVVTDGPFPESKEFLAGYWIVDCESPERAIEIAKRIATAPGRGGVPIGVPVEVRQVMSAPPGEV
jgi:hypothetical protein